MAAYDKSMKPPAATAEIEISAELPSGATAKAKVKILVDTGADMSCIPLTTIQGFQVALQVTDLPHDFVYVEDVITGRRVRAKRYALKTESGHLGNGQEFFFIAQNDPIGTFGRDILNQHRLDLDGPKGQWAFQ